MIKQFLEKIYKLDRFYKSIIFISIDFFFSQVSFYISFFLLYNQFIFSNINYLLFQFIITSSFIIFFYRWGFYSFFFRFFNIFKLLEIFKVCFYNLILLIIFIIILNINDIYFIYGNSFSLVIICTVFFSFFSSFSRSIAVIFYSSSINKKKKIAIIGLNKSSKAFIRSYDKQLYNIEYIFDNFSNEKFFNNIKILNFKYITKVIKEGCDYLLISKQYLKFKIIQNIIEKDIFKKIIIKVFNDNNFISNIKNLNNIYFSNIDLEDLIDRNVLYDSTSIGNYYDNEVVLITGAGGSIGSNLCQQLVENNAKEILCLENSEINLFNLKSRLNKTKIFSKSITKIKYILMDLGSYKNIDKLLLKNKISYIFHAAAYKHVTLVEENKVEAFKNNVTHFINLLKLSIKNNIKNFTLISSDKAVKPKNFMGLTKKICEEILIYYSLNGSSLDKSNFKVVRFGNVFNSSGSVVPIFKDQIKSGGPLTITSRNSTRFFMSIPEAVKLILSTQALSNNYGIFIFEMGRAVSIIEIAKKLIFLNSLSSNSFIGHNEIEIKEIGLRDGEKEHEILSDGEIIKTQNNNIYEVIEERYTEDLIKKILNINNDFYNNNSQEECINKITKLLS